MKKLITLLCITVIINSVNAQCLCTTGTNPQLSFTNIGTSYTTASGYDGQLAFKLTNDSTGSIPNVYVNLDSLGSNFTYFGYTYNSSPLRDVSFCNYTTIDTATIIRLTNINLTHDSVKYLHICFRANCVGSNFHLAHIAYSWGCADTIICGTGSIVPNCGIVGGATPHLTGETLSNSELSSYGLAPISNSSSCTPLDTTTLTFRYYNDGHTNDTLPGYANLMNLKLYIIADTNLGTVDMNSFKIIKNYSYTQISVPNYIVSNTIIIGASRYYELDFTQLADTSFPANPTPFGIHCLMDINHNGYLDDIAEKDTMILSFKFIYNASCPSSFSLASLSLVNNDIYETIGSTARYQNQCGTLTNNNSSTAPLTASTTGNPLYQYIAYRNPSTFVAPPDVSEALNSAFTLKICPNFSETYNTNNYYFNCVNGFHRIRVDLPLGYHMDATAFLLNDSIPVTLTNSCNANITRNMYATATEIPEDTSLCIHGYVNVDIHRDTACSMDLAYNIHCFQLPLYLACDNCMRHNNTPDKFTFTAEYICDNSCACFEYLAKDSTTTVHHCFGECGGSSGFTTINDSLHRLTLLRKTLGWINTSTGYDCSTIGTATHVPANSLIHLSEAYPGDVIIEKVHGLFNGNMLDSLGNSVYTHMLLELRYDNLTIPSAQHRIFDLDADSSTITVTGSGFYFVSRHPNFYFISDSTGAHTRSGGNEMYFELSDSTLSAMDSSHLTSFNFDANIHLFVRTINPNNIAGTAIREFNTPINVLNNLRTQYLGVNTANDTINSCDDWGTLFTILQPGAQMPRLYTTSNCDTLIESFQFQSRGALYASLAADFPYEFKPFAKLNDTVKITIPNGYTYISSDIIIRLDDFVNSLPVNNFADTSQHWSSATTLSPTDSLVSGHHVLTFNGMNGSCFPLIDNKFYFGTPPCFLIKLYLQPDCNAPDTSQFIVDARYTENIGAPVYYQNTLQVIDDTTNLPYTFMAIHTTPNAYLGGSGTISIVGNTLTGFIQICTNSTEIAFPSILFTDSVANSHFSIIYLTHGGTTIYPDYSSIGGQIVFNLDGIGFKTCEDFTFTANFNDTLCADMPMNLDSTYTINLPFQLNNICTSTSGRRRACW